jgi:predicted phage terminase large subunit-like protein
MKLWLRSVATGVMYAANPPHQKTPALTGTGSCVSTTATTPERFVDFYATTATSQSDMERRQRYLSELQRISDFTTDPIVSIRPDGQEEVFDVEIDRTENFIANGVVSHNTRWGLRDLTAQVLKAAAQRGGDDWEVIEFPALLPSGNPLWPEFWSLVELTALKEELPNAKWMAQYQQQPTSDTSAIIKREWWKAWEQDEPPDCEYILQSWDTAFEANNRADYSACTTWGIFLNDETAAYNIILLNAYKDRMEFPTLKRVVLEQYDEYNPDSLIIEKKASGAPLIYELRAMGIPAQEYTPVRGTTNSPNNKMARLNSISDIFASGVVWAPERRWAEEVIDEIASFPSGEHDDFVDSAIMALLRFRQGGFLRLPSDEPEKQSNYRRLSGGYY